MVSGKQNSGKVIEAQHVKKAFGEKVLFNDLNFMLPPNGIVARTLPVLISTLSPFKVLPFKLWLGPAL